MAAKQSPALRLPQRRYLDSDGIIGFLKNDQTVAQRQAMEALFEAAERGLVLLVVSAWTLCEVHHLGAPITSPDAIQHRERIAEFFDNEIFLLADVPASAGVTARELMWSLGQTHGLKHPDAMHVACALHWKCTHFDSFDSNLLIAINASGTSLRGVACGEGLPIQAADTVATDTAPLSTQMHLALEAATDVEDDIESSFDDTSESPYAEEAHQDASIVGSIAPAAETVTDFPHEEDSVDDELDIGVGPSPVQDSEADSSHPSNSSSEKSLS